MVKNYEEKYSNESSITEKTIKTMTNKTTTISVSPKPDAKKSMNDTIYYNIPSSTFFYITKTITRSVCGLRNNSIHRFT